MILHCLHSDAEFLVVSCQDSDVFLRLVSHFDKMSCKILWMKFDGDPNASHVTKTYNGFNANFPFIHLLYFHTLQENI